MESMPALDFQKHITRLRQLLAAAEYTIDAYEHREQFLNEDAEVVEARQALLEDARSIIAKYGLEDQAEKLLNPSYASYLRPTEVAKPIILSFALVSFCTEFEVFISQLVRCILAKDPRLLKSLGSEKTLTAAEVSDLGSYEGVIRRLHDKIVKEIIDSNPKRMVVHHLGKRLALFSEEEFAYDVKESLFYKVAQNRNAIDLSKVRPARLGIADFEEVFRTRHAIVHDGELPVTDLSGLRNISTGFEWAETFLSLRAFRKYSIPIDEVALYGNCTWHGVDIGGAATPPSTT